MPAKVFSGLTAGAVILAVAGTAFSANVVRIASREVAADAGSLAVGVFISNDREVSTIVLPLELRAATPGGHFIDAFDLTVTGRVAHSGLRDLEVMRRCSVAAPDNRCSGPSSHTWSCPEQPGMPPQFFTSPSGVMWVGVCLTGEPLSPGIDPPGEPSITLTFELPYAIGRFEIDTCCMTPANHLAFGVTAGAGDPGTVVVPVFTRGVVTIVPPPGSTPPVALCRDITVSLHGGETAAVVPEEIDGGSYDRNHDEITLALDPPGPFPAGEHSVRLVVSDGLLADTCTATVTVVANRPPVARCKDFQLLPGRRCDRSVYPDDIDAGSYDPDGDPLTLTLEPNGAFPTGTTPVRLIVADGQFADTCAAVVIFADDVVFPFVCPAAVDADLDEQLQPRVPDMREHIVLCPDAEEMTFTQNIPAGWFLAPGLDTITVSGVTAGDETFTCDVPLRGLYEGPVGGPALPVHAVSVDIMPQSCPNILAVDCDTSAPPPLEVVIPGSADFDVTDLKPQTARLGGVPLDLWYVHDVAAPVRKHPDRLCACNEIGGDGHPDVVIEFDVCMLLAAVEADSAEDPLKLVLTVELNDGGSVTGGDCLDLVRPGEDPDPDSTSPVPGVIRPLENYPNPFNSGTVIQFSLGRGGPVVLEIYNVLGQRVRTLTTGTRRSGPHQLSWNGRDDSGRPLASGLYLCRLSAPERREVRKMVLLR